MQRPAGLPFASPASAASAAASAWSASIAMKALRRGCHCAIRARQDCVASRDEKRFCAIPCATEVSDSGPAQCSCRIPGGLHQKKLAGSRSNGSVPATAAKPSNAGPMAFAMRVGDFGADRHARDVGHRLDLLGCPGLVMPCPLCFAGARLWPEPACAMWHAAWCPIVSSRREQRLGAAQTSSANGQRVWNRQPDGGSIGFGGSPASGGASVRCVRIGRRHRRQQRPRIRDAPAHPRPRRPARVSTTCRDTSPSPGRTCSARR